MGGGNGQKAKMAREKNLEKAEKGSQLDSNKKAMSIQVIVLVRLGDLYHIAIPLNLQGMHADIYVHHIRSEVQGARRSQTP
ncbi:uncharacterized protein At2g23090 [Arachis ipaensis]|uniref:uncharacterized protein At2g23090 n=1 Tax=Arachis ipaensis TaxID=130454 RepID=UPI000A2B354B|nr:uncharacterized protein At2g23090 [Arachis ipaensis]